MGSGGAGLQQRARPVSRRSTPTTRMPWPFCAARLLRVMTSGSAGGTGTAAGCATARIAAWICRLLISSRAKAANNSSVRAYPALAATVSSLSAVCPRRASSRSTIARPCATVSSCCSTLNHWRTLARARWLALLRRDDVDLLAVLQHVVERHHLAVDARTAATVAEARVHRIRKVDRRRAVRQIDDP